MTDMPDMIRDAVTPVVDEIARQAVAAATGWRLGDLSERYESGGKVGAVSSGKGDPGGISYGLYQLASNTGTAAAFVKNEGKTFDLVGEPGSETFSLSWKAVARECPDAFGEAQWAFIKRTHYDPVIRTVVKATGVNLDARCPAIRDACWSCSVQHGGAASILIQAVRDVALSPGATDEALLRAIYAERSAYVLGVAARTKNEAQAKQLRLLVSNRYGDELKRALKMGGWA